jgi:hypothetical protein
MTGPVLLEFAICRTIHTGTVPPWPLPSQILALFYLRSFEIRSWDCCFLFPEIVTDSEYWTIFRGPGFLAVVGLGSSPTLPPLPSVSSIGETQENWEKETTCWREGEGAGEEPNQYDRKKLWSSINHSIFSGYGHSNLCSLWSYTRKVKFRPVFMFHLLFRNFVPYSFWSVLFCFQLKPATSSWSKESIRKL